MQDSTAAEVFDLSTDDVMALTGTSAKSVRKWADAGELGECWRTPGGHRRFRRSGVAAFVARRQSAPARAAS